MNPVRASLIGFLIVLSFCAIVLTMEIATFLEDVPKTVHAEAELTRAMLNDHVHSIHADILARIDAGAASANKQLTETRELLDKRTEELIKITDARLAETNSILDSSAARYESVALKVDDDAMARADEALRQSGEVQARFLEREPLLYSRYLAITGESMRTLDAWRRMSEEAAKAAPEVSQSFVEISKSAVDTSKNVSDITSDVREFTKPKGFVRGILVPALTAAPKIIF